MIYFKSDNIVSSLGFSTRENYEAIRNGQIGIKVQHNKNHYHEPFPASVVNSILLEDKFLDIASIFNNSDRFTRLEKMAIVSVYDALSKLDVNTSSQKTGIIISTTKGNIDLLDESRESEFEIDRVTLWKLGDIIAGFFANPNKPLVISNACISGVLAINTAAQLIDQGKYNDIVIVGADIVTKFVVSGFMSFLSLSPEPCKPFDAKRNGLSLGEAASTIIMGIGGNKNNPVYKGGGSANDANHISGPSRNGEGSFLAIKRALIESGLSAEDIDHISAHGTATPYNDEMESIAIDRHKLNHAPVNSLKGYLGHTLGAAGLVETSILLEEMRRGEIVKSAGYTDHGVSKDIKVSTKNTSKQLKNCLKMASGFGGSNAALIISNPEAYD